jgi:hypothetical protein
MKKRKVFMSCSKSFTEFYIKITVPIIRFLGWVKSGDIRKNKPKTELFKAKTMTDYFTIECLPAVKNMTQEQITVESPETIWQFWNNSDGRTTPEIVKASIESVSKFKGDFEHQILNDSTIENYSDLPGYVFDRLKTGQMCYAHFADLLRLNLLKNHGGIWIDATAYMTNFIHGYIINSDFFVFLTSDLSRYPYVLVQNCFIRSKKGGFLCKAWYETCIKYWKTETEAFDYFQHHLMFKALVLKNSTAKNLFAEMPHIPEDETHQLIGNNLLKKFDAKEWEKIRKMSFFQKTTYKIADTVDCSNTYFSKLCEWGL